MTSSLHHAGQRLAHARILLNREPQLGPGVRRAAVLVCRQALEELLTELWHHHTLDDLADAPMRTQLLCLRDFAPEELAGTVAWTWSSLSTLSHAQGYSLSPARSEVIRCLDAAQRLYDHAVSMPSGGRARVG